MSSDSVLSVPSCKSYFGVRAKTHSQRRSIDWEMMLGCGAFWKRRAKKIINPIAPASNTRPIRNIVRGLNHGSGATTTAVSRPGADGAAAPACVAGSRAATTSGASGDAGAGGGGTTSGFSATGATAFDGGTTCSEKVGSALGELVVASGGGASVIVELVPATLAGGGLTEASGSGAELVVSTKAGFAGVALVITMAANFSVSQTISARF